MQILKWGRKSRERKSREKKPLKYQTIIFALGSIHAERWPTYKCKKHLIVLTFLAQLCLMKLFYISDGSDPYKGQVAGLPGVWNFRFFQMLLLSFFVQSVKISSSTFSRPLVGTTVLLRKYKNYLKNASFRCHNNVKHC